MCFRPAEMDTAQPINCPNCGKKIRPTNGVFPSKCPFCKYEADFEDFDPEDDAGAIASPAAPGMGGAPAMPAAPGVVSAPAAPAASAAPAMPPRPVVPPAPVIPPKA